MLCAASVRERHLVVTTLPRSLHLIGLILVLLKVTAKPFQNAAVLVVETSDIYSDCWFIGNWGLSSQNQGRGLWGVVWFVEFELYSLFHTVVPWSPSECVASLNLFPQEQLCHFYHPCALVNVAEVHRAPSCFSLAIKIKEGLGSPCAAAGDAVAVCLTHPGELLLCLCWVSWQVCSISRGSFCWWTEQKVSAGVVGEGEQLVPLEALAPMLGESCSWAGDVPQWPWSVKLNQLQGWRPELEQAVLLCFTFLAKIEISTKINFLKSVQSPKFNFCTSTSI